VIGLGKRGQRRAWQQQVVDRWNVTPGYLKWVGGLLLGILARWLIARLFPEHWERLSRPLIDPRMPIWLAVVAVIAVLVLERAIPELYRQLRPRTEQTRLQSLFGVRWAVPPEVDAVQGPFCPVCSVPLRGTLWSGDFSPTMWVCPSCTREFATPEYPDIRREVERHFGTVNQPAR
jgi:hypothetical protein